MMLWGFVAKVDTDELVRTEPYWMKIGISPTTKTMLTDRLAACQFQLRVLR